jgi:FkbM family methyltransferase
MSLGERIVNAIEARRDRLRKSVLGPPGDFYRNGGNELLYDLPVSTGSLVIDAGGYEGEWTAKMIARYGCRSEIYEPFPLYAEHCKRLYASNTMVRIHAAALGGSVRTAKFSFLANGTSEFRGTQDAEIVDAPVDDISLALDALGDQSIACLKLNIEGGEYEVLERLLATNQITRCNSLLIQFHTQPEGWAPRLKNIEEHLQATHDREWCYPMVWEKWVRKANV